jgi:hypothetical protein
VIAALSLVCTAVVLAAGGQHRGVPAAVRTALARQLVIPVATPAPTPDPVALANTPASVVPDPPAAAPAPAAPAAASTGTAQPHAATAGSTSGNGPTTPATPAATPTPPTPSKAGHVFVIALTAGDTDAFAADSPATYLTGELRPKGALLPGFAPLDDAELPNYIAMTGGQPPNADTRAECATYSDFPANAAVGDSGELQGDGCVYPNTVLSLGDQVSAAGRSWRAYVEAMDQGAEAAPSCRHPESDGPDDTVTDTPAAGETYATRHNPFVYFHSLLDLGDCIADDGPLGRLGDDLKTSATTPNYTFIAPDLCDSGTLASCPDGRPGGLAGADAFLHTWVPKILASPAYRKDGVLLVLFLAHAPGTAVTTAPTKGLVVSRFAKAGATVRGAYDPYGALGSIEELLGLDRLAFAAQAKTFAHAALPAAFPG